MGHPEATEPEGSAPPGDYHLDRTARRDFALLDYRWTHRRTQAARRTLQQLLDPGAALQHMPSPLQDSVTLNLPDLTSLHTQIIPEVPQRSTSSAEPLDRPLDGKLDGTPDMTRNTATGTTTADPAPTEMLEDAVIDGLLEALYTALPDALNDPPPEKTESGNVVGRHGFSRRVRAPSMWIPAVSADVPEEPAADTPEETPGVVEALPPPEPRPYVMGAVPADLPLVTLRSLRELGVNEPEAGNAANLLRTERKLGQGEACFLRAQSALWSWRALRLPNVDILSEGPPHLHRNALSVQRIGPVTLLLGYRIVQMTEEDRRWGFTLGSLEEQVVQGRESYSVEWQGNGDVVFRLELQQQLVMQNLTMLGPVYAAMRRKFRDGYVRNMLELAAE